MPTNFDFRSRAKAAAIHLSLSAAVAGLGAYLVFGLWFPLPYRNMAGGQTLFNLVVSVDLVMGPALTFVAFNRSKRTQVLVRDLAIIGIMQLAALAYGLHVMFIARPVALVL